jgi:hypothetical protein
VNVRVLLMGGEGDSPLQRELVSIAERWGRGIGGDQFSIAPEPLLEAVDAVAEYPLLVIWPLLPCWRAPYVDAAIGDLESGCDVVLGPTVDGDLYLLGLARPLPGVLERFEGVADEGEAVGLAARTAMETGIEIGLLRAERPLRSEADIRAALVDPLTAPQVLALLR